MIKIFLIALLASVSLFGNIKVAASYPYIEHAIKIIAKDKVQLEVLARGDWDPHFVVPKPSLISKLRDADLLIVNGASLENAWLDPLIDGSNNSKIQINANGHLKLSDYINLQDIPKICR